VIGDDSALLVIDPQVDFMPMVEGGPETALLAMAELWAAARTAGLPIVVTQEVHRPGRVDFGRELDGDEPTHCVEGTPGVALMPGFHPRAGEHLIQKRRYSAFFMTDLDLLLRGLGVVTVVVCGFLTDVCVHYTCADAQQLDYRVRLVPEACGGSTPRWSACSTERSWGSRRPASCSLRVRPLPLVRQRAPRADVGGRCFAPEGVNTNVEGGWM